MSAHKPTAWKRPLACGAAIAFALSLAPFGRVVANANPPSNAAFHSGSDGPAVAAAMGRDHGFPGPGDHGDRGDRGNPGNNGEPPGHGHCGHNHGRDHDHHRDHCPVSP